MLNWEGSTQIAPEDRVFRPDSEELLVQFLKEHPTDRIRVVGSRYSASDLLTSPGSYCICIDKLQGIVEIKNDTARVRAGSKLADIYSELYSRGYIIACSPGVISEQSVAGAVGTGTHGQGLRQSAFSDTVTLLRMITVSGDILEISDTDSLMDAYRVNLGCLGIFSEVTFKIRPAVEFTCWKRTVTTATLQSKFIAWNNSFEYAKAWWFVDENQAHVWLSHPTSEIDKDSNISQVLAEIEASDKDFEATIDAKIVQMRSDTRTEDTDAKQFQTVKRFKDSGTLTSDLYTIWCKGIPVRQINTEIAVPLTRFQEACKALEAMMNRTSQRTHYPIILRCTGPSTAWLSPTGGQAVCHFGFVVYYAADGSVSSEGSEFVRAAEETLAIYSGRPHWGKYFTRELYDLNALYPRRKDFKQLCERQDPKGRLQNAYVHLVLDR